MIDLSLVMQFNAISWSTFFDEPLIERLGWALLHSFWVFGLLALMLWCFLRLMPGQSAGLRYVTSLLFFMALPVCFVLLFILSVNLSLPRSLTATTTKNTSESVELSTEATAQFPINQFPTTQHANHKQDEPSNADKNSSAATIGFNDNKNEALNNRFSGQATRLASLLDSWMPAIVAVWLGGILVLSCRLVIGWFAIRRLRNQATHHCDGPIIDALREVIDRIRCQRPIEIFQSRLVDSPLTVGFFKPLILIPASAISGLSVDQLRALIAHEVAHIRRHDYLVNVLQSIMETILFYHPATWWMSRIIREEREHCCDDLAANVCGDRSFYAQALLSMEGLRESRTPQPIPGFSMSARGGSLLRRIQRLAGLRPTQGAAPNWCAAVIASSSVLAMSMFVLSSIFNFNDSPIPANGSSVGFLHEGAILQGEDDGWGKDSDGLRIRAFPVLASMSEDEIDTSATRTDFDSQNEFAIAIEMENLGQEPVTVLDTRYGKGYGASAGKSNTDFTSPFLFSLDYLDENGKLIEKPAIEFINPMTTLMGQMVKEILPGERHHFLIRPSKWPTILGQKLSSGQFSVVVRYHGVSQTIQDRVATVRPESELIGAWSGVVASGPAKFKIAEGETNVEPVELNWGDEQDGLKSAISFDPQFDKYVFGDRPDVKLHVLNNSDKPISFAGPMYFNDAHLTATDDIGTLKHVAGAFYTGSMPGCRVTLQPKQRCVFDAGNLIIAKNQEQADSGEHPRFRTFVEPAGVYKLQLIQHLVVGGGYKDGEGNVILGDKNDWTGTLTTGLTPVEIIAPKKREDSDKDSDKESEQDSKFDTDKESTTNSQTETGDIEKISGSVYRVTEENRAGTTVNLILSVSTAESPLLTNQDEGRIVHSESLKTNDQGQFSFAIPETFRGNEQMRVSLEFSHPGFLTRSFEHLPLSDFGRTGFDTDEPRWKYREQAQTILRNTSLMEAVEFSGTVLLPDGSPAVGATVRATSKYRAYSWKFPDPNHYEIDAEATTDNDGKFKLQGDRESNLTIRFKGYAPILVDADYEPDSEEDSSKSVFRLNKGVRPSGQVVDEDGGPIPFAVVTATRDFPWNEGHMPLPWVQSYATDANGNFVLPPLPKGKFKFNVISRVADSETSKAINESGLTDTVNLSLNTKSIPLTEVILERTLEFDGTVEQPVLNFQAVPTNTITIEVEKPADGKPTIARKYRAEGKFNDQDWLGRVLEMDEDNRIKFIVPTGIEHVTISTGTAYLKRNDSTSYELVEKVAIRRVRGDQAGFKLKIPQPVVLEVEVKVGSVQMNPSYEATYVKSGYANTNPTTLKLPQRYHRYENGVSYYSCYGIEGEEIRLAITNPVTQKTEVRHLNLDNEESRKIVLDWSEE